MSSNVLVVPVILLLSAVKVEAKLSVEGSLCLDQEKAVYRCIVDEGDLDWTWTPVVGRSQSFTVVSNLEPTTRISTLTIGGTIVQFNVTQIISPIIVIATVPNPVNLNGTRMTCGGQTSVISVSGTSLIPTALRVLRLSDNGSEVYIQPTVAGDTSVTYQLSSSNIVIPWTSTIILTIPDNITFFHCQYNGIFTIDSCIIEDSNEERNYTLYSNGTWRISRICTPPQILVTCSDGSWTEDINCPEFDITDSELQDTTASSTPDVLTTTYFPQPPMPCNANMYSIEVIIGSVIGSFVLAMMLGFVMGLLSGFKLSRTQTDIPGTSLTHDMNSSRGPLYEELELNKNVVLTQNISYDTVKKV